MYFTCAARTCKHTQANTHTNMHLLYFVTNYHHHTITTITTYTHAETHVQAMPGTHARANIHSETHVHMQTSPPPPQHTQASMSTHVHTHILTHLYTHLPWPPHTSHMYSQTSTYNTDAHTVCRDCHAYTLAQLYAGAVGPLWRWKRFIDHNIV